MYGPECECPYAKGLYPEQLPAPAGAVNCSTGEPPDLAGHTSNTLRHDNLSLSSDHPKTQALLTDHHLPSFGGFGTQEGVVTLSTEELLID